MSNTWTAWTTGELVGIANMVNAGVPEGESVEEFCRRLLRLAIADGLVKSSEWNHCPGCDGDHL